MPPIAMPVEQYRRTFWRPDRDFLDGYAVERNLGLMPHGIVVGNLCGAFAKVPGYHGLVSVRTQIRKDRFRCIDFCLLANNAIGESVVITPPLLAVEVLQGETIHQVKAMIEDYRELGCEAIWIIDPFQLTAEIFKQEGEGEFASGALALPRFEDKKIEIVDLFDALPEVNVLKDMLATSLLTYTED